MNPHQTSNDTSIRALDPPNHKWSRCLSKDEQAIQLYNVLVQQWNAWAEEDAAEKEENWLDLAFRLKNSPTNRVAGFARSVKERAKEKGGGRATVCWGHCILASSFYGHLRTDIERQGNPTLNQLQQWYPRSDIMGKLRYNEDGPSFPTINGGDPIPIRGTVLQGNNQEQESNVHGENNTPQQSDTPHQHNTPQQYSTPDQSNPAQ
ncbi:hypothetical protein FAGAP_5346 [Fusarium agapanthi]|uniref:Uncharacterized protein n=1 Tax=Fusarium agapanthi TaxID=1803897 RepID=A0A9P5BAA3_9HYPO|nr:hypothetical protein FAGAP_5346 [Fusarium agapanthi]